MIVREPCATCKTTGFWGMDSQANFLVCRDCGGTGELWKDRRGIYAGQEM